MTGWTRWEPVQGGWVSRNARLRLHAEAVRGVGDSWVVTVRRDDRDQGAWATRRTSDGALAAAVALLPRREVGHGRI